MIFWNVEFHFYSHTQAWWLPVLLIQQHVRKKWNRLKYLKRQHMLWSKGTQSSFLKFRTPANILRAVFYKWRKTWIMVCLPSISWPTRIFHFTHQWLITRVPRTTFNKLPASLASVKVNVHNSSIRKRLSKHGNNIDVFNFSHCIHVWHLGNLWSNE